MLVQEWVRVSALVQAQESVVVPELVLALALGQALERALVQAQEPVPVQGQELAEVRVQEPVRVRALVGVPEQVKVLALEPG